MITLQLIFMVGMLCNDKPACCVHSANSCIQVALEVLSYHSMCTDEEMKELNSIRASELPEIDRQVPGITGKKFACICSWENTAYSMLDCQNYSQKRWFRIFIFASNHLCPTRGQNSTVLHSGSPKSFQANFKHLMKQSQAIFKK